MADDNRCRWVSLEEALDDFASVRRSPQSQRHIRPLHWYVACRLVLDGGFLPSQIVPRPPFEAHEVRRGIYRLECVPEAGGQGEQTVLGGLKAKDIDVVVSNATVGPCVAVSIKGTLNAFRNLTNRMEEAVGDCTNLHIAYPNLVYGFLHVLRANRAGPRPDDAAHFLRADPDGNVQANDVALRDGQPVDSLIRYHDVMAQLTGRRGVRDDVTRYESVALALVEPSAGHGARISSEWPTEDSPLRLEGFFDRLYREYDLRYVFAAPKMASTTTRAVWREDSPALQEPLAEQFSPRLEA